MDKLKSLQSYDEYDDNIKCTDSLEILPEKFSSFKNYDDDNEEDEEDGENYIISDESGKILLSTRFYKAFSYFHEPDEGLNGDLYEDAPGTKTINDFFSFDKDDDDILYFGFLEFENLQARYFENSALYVDGSEISFANEDGESSISKLIFEFSKEISLSICKNPSAYY